MRSALIPTLAVCATGPCSLYAQAPAPSVPQVGDRWEYVDSRPPYRVEVVATGVRVPWGLSFLPDGRLLATDRAEGRLYVIDVAIGAKTSVSDVPAVYARGDAGLLDVLVHPRYRTNGWIYLSYAAARSDSSNLVVARGRLRRDSLVDVQVLFEAQGALPANTDHFGGRLLLSDGYLYVTSGDRRVPRDSAQSLSSHLGKVLRLHEDGRLPVDNPFRGRAGALPEIWSLGHRNPQGLALEPGTTRIWVNEHGPQGGDEVNLLRRGANYGWPLVTLGEEYGGGRIGNGTTAPGMQPPLHHFTPSIAPSGLTFYRGAAFPSWRGSLFMGALAKQHLNRLTIRAGRVTAEERLVDDRRWRVRVVAEGPDGFLYLGVDGGMVVRIRPTP